MTGVDASQEATARARSVAGTLGLDTVRVIEGNVNELDAADPTLGAPFDLAYTRLFLVHQADPVATLRQIASLLRPGGWIIAQEPLLVPPPMSFPRLDALDDYWAMLMTAIAQRAGGPAQSVERLPQAAVAAGLVVVRADGSFAVGPPSELIGLNAATLAGARDRIVAAGLATAAEIDAVLAAMAAAGESGHEWATSPFFRPDAARQRVGPGPAGPSPGTRDAERVGHWSVCCQGKGARPGSTQRVSPRCSPASRRADLLSLFLVGCLRTHNWGQ